MAIRPILIDKSSPFLGESCALCKEPFAPGEEIILCPEDATRHHVHCWRANQNRCAAYGCNGQGRPISRVPVADADDEERVIDGELVEESDSKVRTLPTSSFSCAQSCLILAIAISIVIFAVSCFGLWAMLDYLFVEVIGWQYRQPLSHSLSFLSIAAAHSATLLALV